MRAGLVGRAETWPWSSAQAHLAQRDDSGLLDLGACRQQCDLDDWGQILQTGGYTAEGERLRRATQMGRIFGDEAFSRQLAPAAAASRAAGASS